MIYKNENGWYVDPADRVECKKFNSRNGKPIKMIVLHTTVAPIESPNNRERIERWFKNSSTTSSTHFCILRDGTILQGVSVHNMAWHAGESSWARLGAPKGSKSVNPWSIGIDFDTLGRLKKKNGELVDAYGKKYPGQAVERDGVWFDPFTIEQIDSARQLIPVLVNEYNIAEADIVGHCDVSPGRKTDPEPIFPWSIVLSSLRGCEENELARLARFHA